MYSFLKISFRHLWQSRLYAVINIIGLSTGITCTLLAVLYWKDEHGFDSFHKNNPTLYRVTTTLVQNKGAAASSIGGTGQVQGPAFKAAAPQVDQFVRVFGGDVYSDVAAANKSLRLQSLFVDSNFFDFFSFRLLRGDPQKVLTGINAVVITESTARKFFNGLDVVGQQLRLDADPSFAKLGKPMIISGVVEDPPKNSSLRFDALFTFGFMHLSFEDNSWLNAYLGTFVVLHPGADVHATEKQFDEVAARHAVAQLAENFSTYGYDPTISYHLQPITDIHLNPLRSANGDGEGGIINGSNPVYSYVFMGIALFILMMAAINFINISIAGSFKRAKEVGIRKIAGSSSRRIIFQFLGESVILCVLAFLLSLVMMNGCLPLFNSVSGKQLILSEAPDIALLGWLVVLLAVIILLTGFYPAWVLSRFRPTEVLYNKQQQSGRHLFGRGLVVAQFALAMFLLVATIVYHSQMNYIRTKNLGYNPSQVIHTAIKGNRDYSAMAGFLKNELAKEPSIKMLSFGNDGYPEDVQVPGRTLKAQYKKIDENFLAALGIPLKAGSNLSATGIANGAIVNEAFIKASGLQDPIGKQITIDRHYDMTVMIIRGIVKDFHFGSLREPIRPMVMYRGKSPDGGMWVKFEKAKQREAMAALERVYRKAMPGAVFEYSFLDELNARQYLQEQRWQQVISIATAISFIICCLGLFGLAHLATGRRVKEIGIRKVLGASVQQVAVLLSLDFLKLILVAFVISVPASWLVMHNWLRNFAYRTTLGPYTFIIAALLTILVALTAVGFQAIKAAIANPVKSLRTIG